MNSDSAVVGVVGTGLGVIGTATQTNEVLQTISLVVTIIGACISFIIVPLLNWVREAKKDGKITAEEAEEGARTLADGLDKFNETIERGKDKDNG